MFVIAVGTTQPYSYLDFTPDTVAPMSLMESLPLVTTSPVFDVSWGAEDPTPSSGIAAYDVQYRVGAQGVWADWLVGAVVTSYPFGPFDPITVEFGETYYFRVRASDFAGNQESYREGEGDAFTTVVDPNAQNTPPTVDVDLPAQAAQFSDHICAVTFIATDVDADDLTAVTSPSSLPDGLVLTDNGCTVSNGIRTCTWTLAGTINQPSGDYDIAVTVTDDQGASDSATTTITVDLEDASIGLDSNNPVAVQVEAPGGMSPEIVLTAYVTEAEPDVSVCGGNSGDISNAGVSISLLPVGPGSPITALCTQVGVVGTGYNAVLEVECTFDQVPVNTYNVQASVLGNYYVGGTAEDVLVIYDPSLGFTTGGGWFYWPGTRDKTDFGYVMRYNSNMKNIRGSLLLIRHTEDGSIYRVKSNALTGLSIGEFEEGGQIVGWASLSGKATYLEPGWNEPRGNYRFLVYVEDWNQPGVGYDQFWFEIRDGSNVIVPAISMLRPPMDNTVTLNGGNIVVPHTPN